MPTFTDVLNARRTVDLPETPMWSYPVLSAEVGAEVHVKHENVQPTGAFKVRGGLTLLSSMDEPGRGVVTYSTGNHAQSIAYAARRFGAPCVIVMPDKPSETKVRAVRALGAEVVLHGSTLGDAGLLAAKIAEERGMRQVSPGDEPELVAGVGTLYLEMLTAQPSLDAIFVPVGSGSGAAAACVVARVIAPDCRIIAVQSSAAPAAHDSWVTGRLVERPVRTACEGLATGTGFALTQRLMREGLADFLLVSDDDVRSAQRLLLTHAHTLAEGAGAAALAGLLARRSEFAGARVGVVCTGGNAGEAEIASALVAA